PKGGLALLSVWPFSFREGPITLKECQHEKADCIAAACRRRVVAVRLATRAGRSDSTDSTRAEHVAGPIPDVQSISSAAYYRWLRRGGRLTDARHGGYLRRWHQRAGCDVGLWLVDRLPCAGQSAI